MKKTLLRFIAAALAAAVFVSCNKESTDAGPSRRVVLMYAAAYNNLAAEISEDIGELCGGSLPSVGSGDILLVYSHLPARSYDFKTPTNPVLFRAYRDSKGHNRRDTLVTYPDTDVSSSPEVLRKVLCQVQEMFPSEHYGLLVSSHGKGWIPAGYTENTSSIFSLSERREYPPTRELGIENVENSGIDIVDLPDAIPMKLDFLITDACLMGCVEVAYEIKDKCRLFLASPTEVLSDGLIYKTMAPLLTNTAIPDLEEICRQYMAHYEAYSGDYQSASITLVDCERLDGLARACRDIIESRRDVLAAMDRNAVQKYFYNSFHWFYDLRDMLARTEPLPEQLRALDAALADCILYFGATDKFFHLELRNVCGLSMYYPIPESTELNDFYKKLAWNKATGLIQ